MASDNLTGRRKRGMPEKKMAPGIPANPFKAGTSAFGQEAAARRDAIKARARRGDLRLKTAGKTVKEDRDKKNRYLMGD